MQQQIEFEDIPFVCSSCIGSKQARVIRDSRGDECRICQKPFVTFQWTVPGKRGRSTVICKGCALEKDACQSCIRDIKYHIDLPIREAALQILKEEGGNESHREELMERLRASFGAETSYSEQREESKINIVRSLINKFPLPRGYNGNEDGNVLCVYGIEADLDIEALRSYLKASIEHIETCVAGRYAFITFSEVDESLVALPHSRVIDGRRLVFAWGQRVTVPPAMQNNVGAVIREFLRKYQPAN